MKIYENGIYREMTKKEIAAMEEQAAQNAAIERKRPLSESEVLSMLLKAQVNTLEVDDNTALQMKQFYPTWKECVAKGTVEYDKPGFKFSYGDKLFSCVDANPTFQSDWIPGTATASLYTEVCETHDGSKYDPIPYEGNMALEEGLHYTQHGEIYKCTRSTGNPVFNALSELVGLYVEKV